MSATSFSSTPSGSTAVIDLDPDARTLKRKAAEDAIVDTAQPERIALAASHVNHARKERELFAEKRAMAKSPKYQAYDRAFRNSWCCVIVNGHLCGGRTVLDPVDRGDECTCEKRPAYEANYQPTLCETHYYTGGCSGMHERLTKKLDPIVKEAEKEVAQLAKQEMEILHQEVAVKQTAKIRKLLADLDACSAV